MSVIEQLMSAGGGDVPPSIPDPEAGGAPMEAAPAGGGRSEVEVLKELLGLTREYGAIATVTEQERLQAEKIGTIIQTLLASNEKMSDQMSGATPALRKAFGAGG